ncbi:hypothetical protein CC1G_13326 [Coprinopsis cinerea okayama7|uniref:Uncharacterized protein n=1 Tax=Coprinopsis cinerea (strain Okayama-7 / 130 / ATCC MYA-4618 / FGSC 9003) TaxID=240176 RepID=A8PIH6_COPC7|nr:hypothetical protein CC1G_13326 [Coprinopsis cinerea okayama7\|eukprot:XP_001841574.2 hypothetical protein CC1G_13326 [Coprinopsis cinerea okayama7\
MLLTTNPLLQGLTRLRAQKLVNYISARLRHCATHLTDRAEDIDRVPGLFAACWHQFKLDFNHGLLVYALVSLQYPETISAPAFLKSLHRLLVEGGIDSCDAVKREANRHDPPYDDFGVPTSTAWWVDITGNSPPDTTPPNFPITHIIDAFNREPDDAWPPWHLPVIVPQGWDSTKARPLAQSFEDLEKRLLTAETELRSAMEAIDVFRDSDGTEVQACSQAIAESDEVPQSDLMDVRHSDDLEGSESDPMDHTTAALDRLEA